MKVAFNDSSFTIGNRIGQDVCTGCIMGIGRNLKCPTDSEGQCILPLHQIYIDLCSNQVFEL